MSESIKNRYESTFTVKQPSADWNEKLTINVEWDFTGMTREDIINVCAIPKLNIDAQAACRAKGEVFMKEYMNTHGMLKRNAVSPQAEIVDPVQARKAMIEQLKALNLTAEEMKEILG